MIAFPPESGSMMRACRAGLAMGLVLWSGAVLADVPFAEPGECARPREPLVIQPVRGMPAAVSGSAVDAFTPTEPPSEDRPRTLTDLLGLTRTTTTAKTGPSATLDSAALNVGVGTSLTTGNSAIPSVAIDSSLDTPLVNLDADVDTHAGLPNLEVDSTIGGNILPTLDLDASVDGGASLLEVETTLSAGNLPILEVEPTVTVGPDLQVETNLVDDLLGGGR